MTKKDKKVFLMELSELMDKHNIEEISSFDGVDIVPKINSYKEMINFYQAINQETIKDKLKEMI